MKLPPLLQKWFHLHTHARKIYKQKDFKQNAITIGTEKFTSFLNYLNVLKLFRVNKASVFNYFKQHNIYDTQNKNGKHS